MAVRLPSMTQGFVAHPAKVLATSHAALKESSIAPRLIALSVPAITGSVSLRAGTEGANMAGTSRSAMASLRAGCESFTNITGGRL